MYDNRQDIGDLQYQVLTCMHQSIVSLFQDIIEELTDPERNNLLQSDTFQLRQEDLNAFLDWFGCIDSPTCSGTATRIYLHNLQVQVCRYPKHPQQSPCDLLFDPPFHLSPSNYCLLQLIISLTRHLNCYSWDKGCALTWREQSIKYFCKYVTCMHI